MIKIKLKENVSKITSRWSKYFSCWFLTKGFFDKVSDPQNTISFQTKRLYLVNFKKTILFFSGNTRSVQTKGLLSETTFGCPDFCFTGLRIRLNGQMKEIEKTIDRQTNKCIKRNRDRERKERNRERKERNRERKETNRET